YAVHAHRVVGALLQSLEAAAAAAAAEERRRRRALRSAGQCEEDDPFGPPAAQDAEEEQVGGLAPAGDWMLQRLAADCLAQLAHVHSVRGSVREAEYFASRMLSVATERLCAPRLALRARRLLADILARRGALDECSVLLETVARDAEALEEEHAGGDLDGLLVEGDAWRRLGRVDQALARYERVAEHVHRLEACKEHGVVRVLARDVEVRRGLLSADQIKLQESNATTLADDQSGGRDADRVCEHLLLHATPAFDALWRAANLTRSGLGGAVLVPSLDAAGTSADRRPTRGRGAPQAAVYQMALNTYGVLRRVATLAVSSGTSHSVHASTRMLAVSAALMQAYGAASVSAGSGGGVSAAVVASVLDAPLNITVARETVEAMRRRTMVGAPPELTAWPADVLRGQGDRSEHSPDASPGLRPSKHVPSSPCMLLSSNDNDNDDDDGGLGSGRGENMDALRAKFFQDATDGARISALWPLDQTGSAQQHPGAQVSATLSDVLPREWVVCGVSVDSTRDVLLLTRYEHKRSPLVLILPLRAVSLDALDACVDGLVAEGGPVGAFQRVLAGLGEIIQASDRSMKSAPACVTPQDKRTWWERRAQLDKALGELLHRVQNAWFGLFCRLLCPEPLALPSAAVRDALQACVLAHVPRTYAARTRRLVVSDELCALVADAAARCVERVGHEWRDVCGLVWAVYCRRDAAPDLDARVLEEFSDALYDSLSPHVSDTLPQQQNVPMLLDSQTPARHLILALDKHAQQLPWEMMPCLADHPVSRVPSVSFLLDHLLTASKPSTVDPTSVSYVLNPAGDLPRTQTVFEPLIKAHPSWQGIMGRTPSSGEFAHALSSSSIFMYLGHGGGEAYWSRARLRATRVRSVALLFGCSSAVMRLMGEYDAVGTPADYVVAGCRALLGNLWDVGDKDIDRFAVEVLRVWGVLGECERSDGRPVSLAEAVCLARKVCRMPFLTGAAPVVYGLPVYLSSTG
ncbi:separin protein, partial [Coemansia sp. RSA 2603]